MTNKGYLLILIGAVVTALSQIGNFTYLALAGYLVVVVGLHCLPGSTKELRTATFFIFSVLIIWSLRFFLVLPNIIIEKPNAYSTNSFLIILQVFFSVGAFFWVLKAEYIRCPHPGKRTDLLIYSGAAFFQLAIRTIFVIPWFNVKLYLFNMFFQMNEISRFINTFYHVVLIYIFAKLYIETKQ